jgi:predicted O-methyltransferase YrrM
VNVKDDVVLPADADEERLRNALHGVSGYFSVDEAWALYCAVRDLEIAEPARVVEIGSYKGRSTIAICLALSARGSGTCISIDPHAPTGKDSYVREHGLEDTFPEYLANIKRAGVASFATPITETSLAAVSSYDREPIDVLFIDGSHDYDDVKLDIELWTPFLRNSSVVAFNDPYAPGVNRAIREYLRSKTCLGRVRGAYHVNNTFFVVRADTDRPVSGGSLSVYLFVERQSFKLLKLILKGILEALGVVYRRPHLKD